MRSIALLVVVAVVIVVLSLILVLAAVRLWRRRSSRGGEASLPAKPLEKGATLRGGQYTIVALRGREPHCYVYEVNSAAPEPACSSCHGMLTDPAGRYCPHCGISLEEAKPIYPVLLARETLSAAMFAAASGLVDLRLRHKAVVLPLDVFAEPGRKRSRYYRIEPELSACSVVSALDGVSPGQVVTWGIALADGLAYLHNHGVTMRTLGPQHVVICGNEARLLCLEGGRPPALAESDLDDLRMRDVRSLVRVLVDLAVAGTGQEDGGPASAPFDALAAWAASADSALTAAELMARLKRVRQTLSPRVGGFRVGARSDVGRVRELNEDSVVALELNQASDALGIPMGVFAVADGVGGHAAGDVASRMTIEALTEHSALLDRAAAAGTMPDLSAWVSEAALAANQAVLRQRRRDGNDMGSTLVLAAVAGDSATILNVGDSRAYRLSPDGVEQLSTDHSLVERLVAVGQLTREEARQHPQRNVIYRVIGERPELGYDVFAHTFEPGEALLLCSDGLSDVLGNPMLWRLWHEAASPQEAADRMVEAANEAGAPDNVSVVLVQF